jgi:tetratricopeptide (TPR) repeat protein
VRPKAAGKKAVKKKTARQKPVKASRSAPPKVKGKKPGKAAPIARPKAGIKSRTKAAPEARPETLNAVPRVFTPSPAMKAFGHAVNLFSRHEFDSARRSFAGFVERFPAETEMIVRVRSYMAICDQRLSHPPSLPRSAEALYNRGIIELNSGRILEAVSYFEKALKYEPGAAHVLYSLAAAHARLGQTQQAVSELKDAVRLREVLRVQARHDSDFVNLYTYTGFQEIVGWEVVEEPTPEPESSEP